MREILIRLNHFSHRRQGTNGSSVVISCYGSTAQEVVVDCPVGEGRTASLKDCLRLLRRE